MAKRGSWPLAGVMQKLSGDPMFEFLVKLGIGATVGWTGDKISPSKPGLPLNLLLGITGALVGARVAEILEISRFGILEPIAAISYYRVNFCFDRLASNAVSLIDGHVNPQIWRSLSRVTDFKLEGAPTEPRSSENRHEFDSARHRCSTADGCWRRSCWE